MTRMPAKKSHDMSATSWSIVAADTPWRKILFKRGLSVGWKSGVAGLPASPVWLFHQGCGELDVTSAEVRRRRPSASMENGMFVLQNF